MSNSTSGYILKKIESRILKILCYCGNTQRWKQPRWKERKKWRRSVMSDVWLFVTPWTVAYQAPLSMGFSRQEFWSGLPFPSPGDLPDPGIEPWSPSLQAGVLPSEPPGSPVVCIHRWVHEHRVVCAYSGLLRQPWKCRTFWHSYGKDEHWEHYAKRNKPVTKDKYFVST